MMMTFTITLALKCHWFDCLDHWLIWFTSLPYVIVVIFIAVVIVDQVYSRMWEFMSSRDHVLTSSTRVLGSSSSFSSSQYL